MTRKKGPRAEHQEPESWGFAGLTMIKGVSPEVAYGEIVENLVNDSAALAVITSLAESEQGRAFLEQSTAEWAALGFPPPWEKAQEILIQRSKQ